MSKYKVPEFLNLFGCNGWVWNQHKGWADEDHFKYKASFLSMYQTDVQAAVAVTRDQRQAHGDYGILWLEAVGYPDCCRDIDNGYTFYDLEDIKRSLILAEKNLLRCGIPFTADYEFHGSQKANMTRRNKAIRKKYHLDEIVQEEIEERK